MINLDQVRTLEWKVKQAVQLIVHLRRENDALRGKLSDTEVRLQELESHLEDFKVSQNEMESGIRSALEELDNLETVPTPAEAPDPVSPVAYPPKAEEFAAEDPAEIFEKSIVFREESPDSTSEDLAFEEEFARLAAEEEAAVASPVPESVELEASEPDVQPESPEAETPVPEEKRPEQPGLGIF